MRGLEKLHSGDFNDMSQQQLEDGSVLITLSKRGEDKVYKFRVRNLYQPDEEELDANTGEPINEGNIQRALPKVPSKGKKASSKQGD